MALLADDDVERRLETLGNHLSPNNPIRSTELLRGRDQELTSIERELRHFHAIPFIFGERGVGKTSLARTAAQQVTLSDREHVYVACGRGVPLLSILRDVAQELLKIAIRRGDVSSMVKRVEVTGSLTPSIKLALENRNPTVEEFRTANDAMRYIKEIDELLTGAEKTIVVIDELEVLTDDDRSVLAYLVKQAGDQNLKLHFVLVGIAENVQQLMGAHHSAARYIKEISLSPLSPQVLMDIVLDAANLVGVDIDKEILYRIAIIGNGYPHFAHLMGKALLVEAVVDGKYAVTSEIYERGVRQAVNDSIQELKIAYEASTQRRDDVYKHLVWALADRDTVDLRIDQWVDAYHDLVQKLPIRVKEADDKLLRRALARLSRPEYGSIVTNTPKKYGGRETVYRYKRFSQTLMRGHVRLQAELEKVRLGSARGL